MSAIVPSQPVSREFMERPKARFFGLLSFVWGVCVVLVPAAFPGLMQLLESSLARNEDLKMLVWCLAGTELLLISLALIFWRFEKPQRVVRKVCHDWCWGPIIR